MAQIRYDGTAGLYVRNGGLWKTPTDIFVTTGGVFGFETWEIYRKDNFGVWHRILYTDKYGPHDPPTGVTITSLAGGGGTRKARITWTEATTNPLPGTSYDLYIYYYNNTDPTKNQSTVIGAGRTGTQFDFANAGALGDADCFAQLSYQEVSPGTFSSGNAETSHITL
jgi:hypothetical protein